MYNQINEILKAKFPEQEDRDQIISSMGELIISETYVELLEGIKDDTARAAMVEALNSADQGKVLAQCESLGIDLFAMLEAKSKQVMAEAVA